ncbi:GFA family protein [Pseudooceanicola onchidii]|uniref:GFA family protein n=1 Tax=Pseudooceanicola onchidii TaxID=2562279 RepID=UPI0010AA7188|nr:GFA family protein [Pseudooceanicola onchidii]
MSAPVRLTCHCGAVELAVILANGVEGARRCNCSFCRRRGAVTVTAAQGGVRIVKGADDLQRYQWGTRTAEHYFCKTCGIYTHHRRRSRDEFAVNLAAIDGVDPSKMGPFPWHPGRDMPL